MRCIPQIVAIVVAAASAGVAAHDESLGARFVQLDGVDAGDCLDHDSPCLSVTYALAKAEPGNTVKVGAGVFDMSGVDPESYIHGAIRATGGYSDIDHYAESRPDQVKSIVVGIDRKYRNALAVRGFYWSESAAAAARGEISFANGSALQSAAVGPAPCVQGSAGPFPCRNLDFVAQVPLAQFSSHPVSAADLWGFRDLNDGREYAIVGLRNGTAIVDVTDAANPREVVTIPGNTSPWREVKVYQVKDTAANRWRAYAYVTTEAANSGLQVIDLSGLPSTAALANTLLDTGSQHTLYVSNVNYETNVANPGPLPPTLYLAGANVNGGSWRAYSLTNPVAPQLVGTSPTTHYMHDSTGFTRSGTVANPCIAGHDPCDLLVDFDVDQVELWDVTNKALPVLVGTATNPGNRYIHSGWPTTSGSFVIFHDELEEIQNGTRTRIYTLDLTGSLANPSVYISYEGPTTTTDHNGYMRGPYYYVSHYRRGVVVFKPLFPAELKEVAYFDTYLTPSANVAGTDGAWGVYPFLGSRNILVSDIENGLFIVHDPSLDFDRLPGRIGFSEATTIADEGVGTLNVPVRRVTGGWSMVTVDYVTTGGSATEGTDYTAARGTLTWSNADMEDKIITIPVGEDSTVEGSETLTITLSNLTGVGATPTIDGSNTLTVTLADNDVAPPPSGGSSGGGGGGGAADPLLLALLVVARFGRRALQRRPANAG